MRRQGTQRTHELVWDSHRALTWDFPLEEHNLSVSFFPAVGA